MAPASSMPVTTPSGTAPPVQLQAHVDSNLNMEETVAVALRRNRDIIAARLDLQEAEFDKVAAEMYPNPIFGYQIGNLVLGRGNLYNTQTQSNPAYAPAPRHPGVFSQTVHNLGISEIIDIWAKRGLRIRSAEQGLRYKRLLLQDALREITYAVRSAFADIVRKRSELEFSREVLGRYSETVRLSQARFRAGEISEAEFRKIELEGLKYQNAVIDDELDRDLARQSLAALLGFGSADELPDTLLPEDVGTLQRSVADLTHEAIENRPDMRAIAEGRRYATASLASARREAYPDLTLGVTYVHSEYQVAGDNPNTLAFGASMPIPFFDRNQANIGRAEVGVRRSDNDTVRLTLQIRHEVAEAVRRFKRAETLLALFKEGGMLERAETSLRVAEKSYKAGAVSLLEFLESQRTYLETHDEYLRAQYDHQQSAIDLIHALGKRP
jgi:cobalt-zinc-cadmium efflux system outer membrane protein